MEIGKFNRPWDERKLDNKYSEQDTMLSSGISEGRAFRRSHGFPDMTDAEWEKFQHTGVEPTNTTLPWKIRNVNLENRQEVASLQYTMSINGIYNGPINGIPGKMTVDAMRAYQKSRDTSIMDTIIQKVKEIF